MNQSRIGLVGCGKMGSALLQGWLNAKIEAIFHVLDPYTPPNSILPSSALHFHTDIQTFAAAAPFDIVILAVKPQSMAAVCAELQPHIAKKTVILSIAAGQTLAQFAARFGADQPVIRAMPNTPAAIGQGMTVAVVNAHVTAAHHTQALQLLAVTGRVEWIADEQWMDAVTALSGSGPAYVFYLIEVLAAAGVAVGLNADLAMTLARQTVIGAAALAAQEPDTPAATLRQSVTSPGGTTAAALDVLSHDANLQKLFDDALKAATRRGRELGGN